MAKLSDDLKNISKNKGVRVLSTLIFLVLVGWLLMRACTGGPALMSQTYRIARDPNWYPLDLLGKEINMLAFTNELFMDIAKRKGMRFELEIAGSEGLMFGLNNGTFDGIMSTLDPSPMADDRYEFSAPFYLIGPVLIVNFHSRIESFHDLEGETVAVHSGSLLAFQSGRFPNIFFATYGNMREALDDLQEDKVDGVIMDAMLAYSYVKGPYSGLLKVVGLPLSTEGLRLVTREEPRGTQLVNQFDEGLNEMVKDGTFQELLVKWGLFDTFELSARKEAELIEAQENK